MDPEEEISKGIDKFPFVLVLASTVLKGTIFVFINLPLLIMLLEGISSNNLSSLISNNLIGFWTTTIQSSANLITLSVFLILCLVVGTLLTPFERLLTYIIVFIVSMLKRRFGKKASHLSLFSSAEMAKEDYAEFLSWLFTKPQYKSHWEWELYNFYNFWSIETNILIFVFFVIVILGNKLSATEIILITVFALSVLAFALLHSLLMGRVHKFYKGKFLSNN